MSRRSEANGQAAVEFVTLLPLLCLVLAGAWQAVLAAQVQWSASAAARAAARARAVGAEDLPTAARRSLPASLDRRVEVEETARGVEVRIAIPGVLPGIELGTLSAHATFASQR